MNAVLVDTNVLVYEAETGDSPQRAVAQAVLAHLGRERVVVSVQVLSEFANVLTHPSKMNLPASVVRPEVARLAAACRVIPLDERVVLAALDARDRWGLPYHDAQIWAAAALNGIQTVLSEDFASGSVLGGVRFVDPFEPGFDPASL
jgi:predicted nucleic acid-binding protein